MERIASHESLKSGIENTSGSINAGENYQLSNASKGLVMKIMRAKTLTMRNTSKL